MTITSVSVVMTVMVLNIHHSGPVRKELPDVIRQVLIKRYKLPPLKKSVSLNSSNKTVTMNSQGHRYHQAYPRDGQTYICNLAGQENPTQRENYERDTSQEPEQTGVDHANNSNFNIINNISADSQIMFNKSALHYQILQTLNNFILKHDTDDRQARVIQEWRLLASLIDAILFWFFFLATSVSSFTLLIGIPYYNRDADT